MCIYFYEWLWRRLHFDNVGECYGRKKKLNINHISFVSAFTVEWIEYSGKLFPHWNIFSSESISCGKQIWQTICRSVIACVLVCVQKCYRKYSGCQMCMWINNNLHFSNLLFFFFCWHMCLKFQGEQCKTALCWEFCFLWKIKRNNFLFHGEFFFFMKN